MSIIPVVAVKRITAAIEQQESIHHPAFKTTERLAWLNTCLNGCNIAVAIEKYNSHHFIQI